MSARAVLWTARLREVSAPQFPVVLALRFDHSPLPYGYHSVDSWGRQVLAESVQPSEALGAAMCCAPSIFFITEPWNSSTSRARFRPLFSRCASIPRADQHQNQHSGAGG